MKSFIFTSLIVFTLISCSGEQHKNDPDISQLLEEVNNKQLEKDTLIYDSIANYTITFPVLKVEEQIITTIVNGHELDVYYRKANMQGKNHINLAYQVSYCFLPNLNESEIKELYDDRREYFISATNSVVEYERIIDIHGTAGRHLLLSVDGDELKTTCRLVYRKGVFYTLVVVTEKGNLFNNNINKFLESFHFIQ